jgi:hypothetical protein
MIPIELYSFDTDHKVVPILFHRRMDAVIIEQEISHTLGEIWQVQ